MINLIVFAYFLLLQESSFWQHGTVVRVLDGDTVVAKIENRNEKIRLRCIDAPERKQEHGQDSAKALQNRILNQEVKVLSAPERDPYGRLIADLYVGQDNINLWMVLEGKAWVYTEYCRDASFYAAEQAARVEKRGLWGEKNQMEPWKFRRLKKSKQAEVLAK